MGRRTKFEHAVAVFVDEHYPELQKIDAMKSLKKASAEDRIQVYARLRIWGVPWVRIAEYTMQDPSTLWRFRRKHDKELADETERLMLAIDGLEAFCVSLVSLMRAGNVEALKLYAVITGRVKHKMELEGKLSWIDAIRNAADGDRPDQSGD